MSDWRDERDAVSAAFARYIGRHSRRTRIACPMCEAQRGKRDTSLALSVEAGTGLYYCWRCKSGGKIVEGVVPLDGIDLGGTESEGDGKVDRPPGFLPLAEYPWSSAEVLDEVRAYAARRKLTPQRVAELGVGAVLEGKYAGRIVVPILALGEDWHDERWSGWVARDYTGRHPAPYLYPVGMNRHNLLFNEVALYEETDVPLLVAEGVLDAIPHEPDAVAVLGKPSPGQIEKLLSDDVVRPVVWFLDGDAWEESMMWALRFRFEGKRSGFIRLPPKTDPHVTDPAWARGAAAASLDAPL